MGSMAVAAVFASAELLDAIILSNFTRREAAQVAGVSRDFKAAAQRCMHQLRPRLIVASSGNSKLVEINPWTGEVLRVVSAHRTAKQSRLAGVSRQPRASRWCTSLRFSPYDHALYLCQYKDEAVLRYCGGSLRYTNMSARGCPAPEGVAFACGYMYIASVESSRIMKFTLKGTYVGGFDLGLHLPWGMVAFRDALGEALYVCLDEPFEANNYGTPNPAGNRGFVLRIYLDEDGSFNWQGGKSFCGRSLAVLPSGYEFDVSIPNRPSGLCFDDDGQHLYVTSLPDKVLKFAGPNHPEPGTYLGVAIDLMAAGLAHPFDVCWQRETRHNTDGSAMPDYLIVTTHMAEPRRKGRDNKSRVSFFTEDGALLKSIEAPVLDEPNMVAME